jgi:hypothetical protein
VQPEPGLRPGVEQRRVGDADRGPGRGEVAVAARDDHRQPVHSAAKHDHDQGQVVTRRPERDPGRDELGAEGGHPDRAGPGDHPPPGEPVPPAILLGGEGGGDVFGLDPHRRLGRGRAVAQQFSGGVRVDHGYRSPW